MCSSYDQITCEQSPWLAEVFFCQKYMHSSWTVTVLSVLFTEYPMKCCCLLRDPVNLPVTFALDLPTHSTAVAQRKQLLLLALAEKTTITHPLNLSHYKLCPDIFWAHTTHTSYSDVVLYQNRLHRLLSSTCQMCDLLCFLALWWRRYLGEEFLVQWSNRKWWHQPGKTRKPSECGYTCRDMIIILF